MHGKADCYCAYSIRYTYISNSLWQFYIKATSTLVGCFMQLVVLTDDGPVRSEICACKNWWSV